MAKITGLGWTALTVTDSGAVARDIRNDISNLQFSTPRGVIETTGIDKFAMERLLGLADFQMTLNGTFNPSATTTAHAVLRTAPSTSVARAVVNTVGGVSLNVNAFVSDYQITRADNGALTYSAPFALSDGNVPTWA